MSDLNCISTPSSSSINSVSSGASHLVEPRFRLACEECHLRKIRCEPSLAGPGGSCEACRLNQRRCLFSLRSKIGRPRKQTSSSANQKEFEHKSPILSTAGGYAQQNAAIQVFPSLDDTHPNPNTARHLDMSPQSRANDSRRPVAEDSALWEKPTWHSNPKIPTGSSVNALRTGYVSEDNTTRSGAGGEPFGQLINQNSIGAQVGLFMSDLAQTADSIQTDALMMESWFIGDNTVDNSEIDVEQGFRDALKLYGELHSHCKTGSLNILDKNDQEELCSIFRVFDELNHNTSMLQNDLSTQQQRTDESKWRIIRVAVTEAIEMCIGVVQFNLRLHNSPRPVRCPLEESCSTGSGNVAGCNCLASQDDQRLGIQLKGLMLLIHLDYSLVRFRFFISKLDCLHGGDRSMQGPKPQQMCKCWSTSVPEIDTIRSQVSGLVERVRSLWD
ncbi:hypothetical protein ETB97_008083 [Aspergillus alliaceus]|uniref:Zn(2)-C6 fungal-type domain-containing protein n=1 Tax=Petromyces alliaceus TaxID=209559 RepID=A0A5N7CKI0_PETAA|nr:hypothetical protein BDV23DRAFT_179382 [Aspergillus alliaceus]KAF5864305.1 hypothetical protein ETB97_008083 [Aspergillus burnettii]